MMRKIDYPEYRKVRGVAETELLCSTCRYWLPDDKFYRKDQSSNNKYRRGRSYHCKVCDGTRGKEAYERNAEARREHARDYRKENPGSDKRTASDRTHEWRKQSLKAYGMTVAEYDEMLVKQGGKCAVCVRPERKQRGDQILRLSVDHDHDTGEVRGLLCSTCNTGLGQFRDDPDLLISAAAYIMEHKSVLGFAAGTGIG